MRRRTRPPVAERFAASTPAAVTSRAALAAPAGAAQERVARAAERATLASDAVRRLRDDRLGRRRGRRHGARRASSSRPGRSTSPRARGPTTGAWRGPCSPPAFAPATWCTTASAITSRPAGAMMESGAVRDRLHRLSRPAPARPSCSCRRWPTLRPDAYVGTPSFLRILLEKADETGVALPSLKKASLGGEAFPRGAARLARGARHRRLPELRHRRPRPGRLRDRGARRPGRRRGRDRRDRAPGHRRSGRRGRGRRGRRDDAQPRLPADPLRHRRPFGGAARRAARPAAPTSASAAGSAAPTSRPRCAACSSTRRRWPRSCAAIRRSRGRGWSSSGELRRRPHDAARSRSKAPRPKAWPSASPRTIREVTKLRGEVAFVAPGSLPNDGKVIEDLRSPRIEGAAATDVGAVPRWRGTARSGQ